MEKAANRQISECSVCDQAKATGRMQLLLAGNLGTREK
jgi:hypothetical protein